MSTTSTIRSEIVTQFTQVAEEHGNQLVPLTDDLQLLESGLDSLSVAVIVARLENQLGLDPFNSSEEIEFPVTFGDFVKLYENTAK